MTKLTLIKAIMAATIGFASAAASADHLVVTFMGETTNVYEGAVFDVIRVDHGGAIYFTANSVTRVPQDTLFTATFSEGGWVWLIQMPPGQGSDSDSGNCTFLSPQVSSAHDRWFFLDCVRRPTL